jgi:hypothetical protein
MVSCSSLAAWPASDSVSNIKEVDVGQATDLGTPARIIGKASLLHRLALLVRTFDAEEALRLVFCRASYVTHTSNLDGEPPKNQSEPEPGRLAYGRLSRLRGG